MDDVIYVLNMHSHAPVIVNNRCANMQKRQVDELRIEGMKYLNILHPATPKQNREARAL